MRFRNFIDELLIRHRKEAQVSYSQEGEELILKRLFYKKENGFYVDIGAHNPIRFSNTWNFYKNGWHGINIDANPDAIKSFSNIRKRDINIAIGVGENEGKLKYYVYNESALNTFDEKRVENLEHDANLKPIDIKEIEIQPLEKIFEKYLPMNQKIDFMDIDVEGLDYQVLLSNNWKKYKPTVVLVEGDAKQSIKELFDTDLVKYMREQGYEFYSRLYNTMIFIDANKVEELF